MPSGAVGLSRRLAVIFLGASAVFHEPAQVASACGVDSDLRAPTANKLRQGAADDSSSAHAIRQHVADAEGPTERGLSEEGRDPTTECMEGQSFTVYDRQRPDLSGCYSDSGMGRVAALSGQYAYFLFEDAAMVNDKDAAMTAVMLARTVPEIQDAHWVVVSLEEETPDHNAAPCVSFTVADRFNHPADSEWTCDLPGNGTGAGTPDANDFNVSCGCLGVPRTKFDRTAVSATGARKGDEPPEDTLHNQMLSKHKQYPVPEGALSSDIDIWIVIYCSIVLIAGAVKLELAIQRCRNNRSRASPLDQSQETGTELPERRNNRSRASRLDQSQEPGTELLERVA